MTDMFSPGGTLRLAREKHKLTQADIAEATRIKVHIIDAIENNDFSQLSTPLYAKGFIKMYAERVGLDPEPLIRDYLTRHSHAVRPTLNAEQRVANNRAAVPIAPPRSAPSRGSAGVRRAEVSIPSVVAAGQAAAVRLAAGVAGAAQEVVGAVKTAWGNRPRLGRVDGARDFGMVQEYGRGGEFPVGRYAAIAAAVIAIAIVAGMGISLLKRQSAGARPVVTEAAVPAPVKAARPATQTLRMAEEPPPPYLKPRKR